MSEIEKNRAIRHVASSFEARIVFTRSYPYGGRLGRIFDMRSLLKITAPLLLLITAHISIFSQTESPTPPHGEVQLLDAANWRMQRNLKWDLGEIFSLSFSPDKQLDEEDGVATGSGAARSITLRVQQPSLFDFAGKRRDVMLITGR